MIAGMNAWRVTTRPEQTGDFPFLVELYQATRETEAGWSLLTSVERNILLASQCRMQAMGYARQYPDASRVIIEADGRPVGRIYVADRPEEIHLIEISLLPEFRGHGIGARMVRALQDGARVRGVPVRLHVWRESGAAVFYQRLGFRVQRAEMLGERMEWQPTHSNKP